MPAAKLRKSDPTRSENNLGGATETVKRLPLRQVTRRIVGFAPARRAAIQNVGRLQQCARLINRAQNRKAIPFFVAACEPNLRAHYRDLKLRAFQAIRVEGGDADQVSSRIWTDHHRHGEGLNI